MKWFEKKYNTKFAINLGLFFTGIIMVFSGLIIQFSYHMGNHGGIDYSRPAIGFVYAEWSEIHKISILIISVLVFFHIRFHWKFYKMVLRKKLVSKNSQVMILSVLFVLVAITGYIPWMVHLAEGSENFRKAVMEVHDKLALLLTVYLVLHLIKRAGWYFGGKAKYHKKVD